MCPCLINCCVTGAAVFSNTHAHTHFSFWKPSWNHTSLTGGYCTFWQNIIKSEELLFFSDPAHKSILSFCCKDGMGFHKCSLNSYSKDRLCPHKKKGRGRGREKGRRKGKGTGRGRNKEWLNHSRAWLILSGPPLLQQQFEPVENCHLIWWVVLPTAILSEPSCTRKTACGMTLVCQRLTSVSNQSDVSPRLSRDAVHAPSGTKSFKRCLLHAHVSPPAHTQYILVHHHPDC